MTRRALHRLLLAAVLGITAPTALTQSRPFLVGTVRRDNGVPAYGLEVRLVHGSEIVAATFTDRAGYFAFHRIQGQPNEFHLVVVSARTTLYDRQVPNLPPGSQLSPIIVH
jgi:hypothetical protein